MTQSIASETGVDEEIVRRLCFAIDGGSGGFAAVRHDMTYDQAIEAHRKTWGGKAAVAAKPSPDRQPKNYAL